MRVLATGVFDLLHLGHLHFFRKARELGDELVVVVATDSRVRKLKHEPIVPQEMRVEMVSALRPVDKVVLGREDDMYGVVEELRPDIIALGYDQHWDEEKISADLATRGLSVKVVRLPKMDHDLDATRKMIRRVLDAYSFQKKMEAIEGQQHSDGRSAPGEQRSGGSRGPDGSSARRGAGKNDEHGG